MGKIIGQIDLMRQTSKSLGGMKFTYFTHYLKYRRDWTNWTNWTNKPNRKGKEGIMIDKVIVA